MIRALGRLLVSHMSPYRRQLALVVVLQTVQTVAMLMLPAINADLIDEGVLAGDNGVIWSKGGEMMVFVVIQIIFAAAAVWFGAKVAMGFSRDVRRDLFHQVTGFSAREVAGFGAPSLITRITNDVQQVQMLVVLAATMALSAPIMMIAGVFMAMREDVGLSIVIAVAVPVIVLMLGVLISQMVPAFQLMQARIDRINAVLREQITGMRVVRAFVREPQETVRFEHANADVTEVALRTGRIMAAMFPLVILATNVSNVAVLWLGAGRIERGDLQIGSLVAYLTYLLQILMSVVMVTFMISMIPRAAVASERIVEVLDAESTVQRAPDAITDMPALGTVEFRDVGFTYPGAEQPVLTGLDFRVPPGTTTAVIGSTGAGKTTLVNLVPRLFDATSGTVLVNGVDVKRLDPDLLWGRVGYVPQRAYLFSGTVASNLRFGKPDATDAELWQALTIAQAADFVQSMPDGIDSRIEQGGTNVSGGQRQRLAIARALVVRPDLYVFDDSFSALDLATDARLRAALRPHTSEAAVLIVAQRVSTIRDADQIIVLERGQIVGKGSHDELVETCPTYAEIVESQHGQGAAA